MSNNFDKLKLKSKGTMGAPPAREEVVVSNLLAPEHAPAPPVQPDPSMETKRPTFADPSGIDGRTLRRGNRTVTFSTRVTADFERNIKKIAQQDGVPIVVVIERALEAYIKTRNNP